MLRQDNFASMSDQELIDGLISTPTNNKLHEYFFNVKCKKFLKYISSVLYNEENHDIIVGEFFEYISNDDWRLLRKWKGKNGCTLYSYLAACSMRYFLSKRNNEKKRNSLEESLSTPEIIECLNYLTTEDECDMPPIWDAYNMLNERDKTIIRLLVIEERDMLQVAPEIWKFIKSSRTIEELNSKQIQSTISMVKHRALLTLMTNLKKFMSY